jgi:hypothetical protein
VWVCAVGELKTTIVVVVDGCWCRTGVCGVVRAHVIATLCRDDGLDDRCVVKYLYIECKQP